MPTPKKFCIRNWSVKPNPLTLVDIFNAINLHLLNVVANIHQSPNHHKDSKLPGNKYCLIIITVIDLTGRDS